MAKHPRAALTTRRAVQADGNDYSLALYKEAGRPVEGVYATEGTPQIIVETGIFRSSPNPNAACVFQNFLFSVEGQQIFIDFAHRSFHAPGEGQARPDPAVRDQDHEEQSCGG